MIGSNFEVRCVKGVCAKLTFRGGCEMRTDLNNADLENLKFIRHSMIMYRKNREMYINMIIKPKLLAQSFPDF